MGERSGQYQQGSTPPSTLVGFKANGIEGRNKWVSKRPLLTNINRNTLTRGPITNKIYINEDFSKTTKSLIRNAKKKLRGIYELVWVTNGKVLVKKKEGEQAVIRNESEINVLYNKIARYLEFFTYLPRVPISLI